jgi:hypothetical protein
MGKALVIGNEGSESHENTVRSYFIGQAPTWTCDIAEVGSGTSLSGNIITHQSTIGDCVSFAIANSYNVIIRSYIGVWSYKLEWDVAYANNIQVVHAHGSNSHILLSTPPYIVQSAICCGGGVTANERSYGYGLEFFDYGTTGDTEESWSTAVVAGKLCNILDGVSGTMVNARYRAQMTGSSNQIWNINDGYGLINVSAAINYYTIPESPPRMNRITLSPYYSM